MSASIDEQRVPIFISSTFRDMDRERDLVNGLVIPAVNGRLADRAITTYSIDLRWGVDTSDRSTVLERQQMILEVCIDEVERCRPLFVGLIGERYGMIPADELQQRALDRLGVDHPGFPLSVLAIEMIAACRAAEADGNPPIVLRREPPPGVHQTVDAGEAGLVQALVDHLRHRGVEIISYALAVDDDASSSVSNSAFVGVLTDAIIRACEGLPRPPGEVANWLDRELNAQITHRRRLVDGFVGRVSEIDSIQRFCDPIRGMTHLLGQSDVGDDIEHPVGRLRWQRGSRRLSIIGPSGVGKSALVARTCDLLQEADGSTPFGRPEVTYVSVGATPATDRLAVCLLVLLAQLQPAVARGIAERVSPADLTLDDVHQPWLDALDTSTLTVTFIDGLDRLAVEPDQSVTFGWLPERLGVGHQVVVTAAEHTLAQVVLTAPALAQVLHLDELTPGDAHELIRRRIAAHHRAMPEHVATLLVERSCLARWLVVATDLLLTLSRYDYEVVERAVGQGADAEAAVGDLLRAVAQGLPRALDDLHQEVFERLTDLLGESVLLVLALVGMTMNGLRPSDLTAITALAQQPLTEVDLAIMRSTLGEHVTVDRDRWTFVHPTSYAAMGSILDEIGDEIETDVTRGLYGLLAAHLAALPVDDPVRRAELLGVLFMVPAPATVAAVLHDPERTSVADIRRFASVLLMAHSAGADVQDGLVEIVTAARSPAEQLTAVSFALSFIDAQGPERARPLADALLTALDELGADERGRHGESAEALTLLLRTATVDPFSERSEDAGSPGVQLVRWQRALTEGEAGVEDAPSYLAGATDATSTRRAVQLEFSIVATIAQSALLGVVDAETPALTAARFIAASRAMDRLQFVDSADRDAFHLARTVAARSIAVAWPDISRDALGVELRPVDLAGARRLADSASASTVVVSQYAQLARLSAMARIPAIEDGTASAEAIYDAIETLDRALDRLAVERSVLPDVIAVENEWMVSHSVQAVILEVCGQTASACRHAIAMTGHPRSIEMLGWEQVSLVAFGAIIHWSQVLVRIDPTPVLDTLSHGHDQHGPPRWCVSEDMPWAAIELMMLHVALEWWKRTGDRESGDHVLARVERTLGVEIPDHPMVDEEGFTVSGLADDAVRGIEDEIVEEVAELLEDEGAIDRNDLFDAENLPAIGATIDTVRGIRSILEGSGEALPGDPIADAFWSALDHFVRPHSGQERVAIEQVGAAVGAVADLDLLPDRDQQRLIATFGLLGLDPDEG